MKKNKKGTYIFILFIFISQLGNCQPNRIKWQPPDIIMDSLEVTPGMIIGEIGAGEGYMTFPLLEKVGPEGKIYANDISSWSLRVLGNRKERESLDNLEVVKGKTDDPMFPVKNLDMIIMVYVFHDLTQPVDFTGNTLKYLKNSGLLTLIEKDIIKDSSGVGHFLPQQELLELMAQTGYKLVEIKTFLKNDNIYIFAKK